MGENFEFKKLVDSNLSTINELSNLFPNWKKSSVQKKIRDTLEGKNERFIVLSEGKIIGHLKVTFGKGLHKHRADLSSLVVHPSFRKKGVGSKLVKFVLDNLPQKIFLVLLAVDKNNTPAISLHKKLGFKKYGVLSKASFVDGKYVDNYLMKKELKRKLI
ncbi:MAG: GNAT family N-acetyltransferase [Candidatus Iainarchaeum sp.]